MITLSIGINFSDIIGTLVDVDIILELNVFLLAPFWMVLFVVFRGFIVISMSFVLISKVLVSIVAVSPISFPDDIGLSVDVVVFMLVRTVVVNVKAENFFIIPFMVVDGVKFIFIVVVLVAGVVLRVVVEGITVVVLDVSSSVRIGNLVDIVVVVNARVVMEEERSFSVVLPVVVESNRFIVEAFVLIAEVVALLVVVQLLVLVELNIEFSVVISGFVDIIQFHWFWIQTS